MPSQPNKKSELPFNCGETGKWKWIKWQNKVKQKLKPWYMGEKVKMVLILPSNSHQMFVFVLVFAWQRKDSSHLPTDTYKVLLRAVDVFWGESLRFSDRLGPPHRFYINLRNSFCFAQILWSPDSTMTTILCQFPFLTGSSHWAWCWHIVTIQCHLMKYKLQSAVLLKVLESNTCSKNLLC